MATHLFLRGMRESQRWVNANDPIKPEVTVERAVETDSEVPETDYASPKENRDGESQQH